MRLYHNYLFLFGFIYYLIIPVIVGKNGCFENFPGMRLFYENFPNGNLLEDYYIKSSLVLISFYLGSYSALFFRKRKKNNCVNQVVPINKWIFITIAMINQMVVFLNRDVFFTGYTLGYQVDLLGKISTLNCIYLFVFLYLRSTNQKGMLHSLSLFLLIENSILLLSLGSRMYVLIPFIGCFIYMLDRKLIKFKKLLIHFVVIIIAFLAIGLLRQGSNINVEGLVYIGFAEPLFTWISAGSFITQNSSINLIDFPGNFLGTFINFVPTFIFPNKASYIASIPYPFDTPLGASSIIPNLFGNFGLLITPFVIYIGGFLLTFIRYYHTYFFQVYYYCCCSLLPFILFRDMQSVNKLLFTSFLMYPAMIFFLRVNFHKLVTPHA